MAKNPAALVDTSAMRNVSTRGMTVSAFVLKGSATPRGSTAGHRRAGPANGNSLTPEEHRCDVCQTQNPGTQIGEGDAGDPKTEQGEATRAGDEYPLLEAEREAHTLSFRSARKRTSIQVAAVRAIV